MPSATDNVQPAPSALDEAAKLRADNDELRRKSAQAEARKAFPPPKAAAQTGAAQRWFRCGLQHLPAHMAIHVAARSEDEARRRYCERMGLIWNTEHDEPLTSDRLIVEEAARPPAKLMRGKFTRDELLSLGFAERELDEAAI
jgi:hypothetical protein